MALESKAFSSLPIAVFNESVVAIAPVVVGLVYPPIVVTALDAIPDTPLPLVLIVIFALPSKVADPFIAPVNVIVLAVCSFVAVAALPFNDPEKLGAFTVPGNDEVPNSSSKVSERVKAFVPASTVVFAVYPTIRL